MSKVVDGLLYSESHEWVKVDGNIAIACGGEGGDVGRRRVEKHC